MCLQQKGLVVVGVFSNCQPIRHQVSCGICSCTTDGGPEAGCWPGGMRRDMSFASASAMLAAAYVSLLRGMLMSADQGRMLMSREALSQRPDWRRRDGCRAERQEDLHHLET